MTQVQTRTALQVMERLYEGFAGGETSVADELCAPEYVSHVAATRGEGAEAIGRLKEAIRVVHEIMPDGEWTIEEHIEKDDTIWTRTRGAGTATGPYFGTRPNVPVELYVMESCRIRDGRIVEHWGVSDRFELLVQTGLISRLTKETPGGR